MNSLIYMAALAVSSCLIIVLSTLVLKARRALGSIKAADESAQRIIAESKKEAESIKKDALLEAKDKILSLRTEIEKQTKERKVELQNAERRLTLREEQLEKRDSSLGQKEKELSQKDRRLTETGTVCYTGGEEGKGNPIRATASARSDLWNDGRRR